MIKFKYSTNHGNSKKGDVVDMQKSTADALVAHKIGTIEGTEKKAPKKKATKPGTVGNDSGKKIGNK
jgi:hypothetical protein